MWSKLNQEEFTTFRFPRKDRDWQIGERVQVVYHPRSRGRKPLFWADILNVQSRSFDSQRAPAISHDEAVADGFPNGVLEMERWLAKSHGKFDSSKVFNKLSLKRVPSAKGEEK